MKLLRYLWWSLVVVVSLGVWWLIAERLEPKPLWTIRPEDNLEFSHFHQGTNRLVAVQPATVNTQNLIVFDTSTGNSLATQNVLVSEESPGSSQAHDYRPRRPSEFKTAEGDGLLTLKRVKEQK